MKVEGSKINIYKTIEKAISADFFDSISDYVAMREKGVLVKIFRRKEDLLKDTNSEEFKKIIDDALNNGNDIYISLAKICEDSFDGDENHFGIVTANGKFNIGKYCMDESSDYGIMINRFLFFQYIKRSDSNSYDNFPPDAGDYGLIKFIHDCIVYDEPGEESFQIITYDEWLKEMGNIDGFNELSDDLKKALYQSECEIDVHLDEINEYEMRFWYGGGAEGAPYTGHDMIDSYVPEIVIDYLKDYISKYVDEEMEIYM